MSLKSVPWVWVILTAVLTFMFGPKVLGTVKAKSRA